MFGIDQISWGDFIRVILFILLFWYISLILLSLFYGKGKSHKTLFEDDFTGTIGHEDLSPIAVSSGNYPSEMIPMVPFGAIPLPVSFYEEMGVDDGYSLDQLRGSKDPLPTEILQQIQFQQ